MTHQDYLTQNALGFEGDTFLKSEIERLIKKHKVEAIIETGTYMGATTLQFAEMVKLVYTIEVNEGYFKEADALLKNKNIIRFLGSSVKWLPKLMVESEEDGIALIFLDAHWGPNNPLLEELKIIADAKNRPVIAIHDFKVPEHPELGFDSYGGQDYDWEWIKESIEAIYGEGGYDYHYNSEATGAKRGVIFIEPKTF